MGRKALYSSNAERQAAYRERKAFGVTLTLGESLELLALIRDKGLAEFARDNDEFRSVLRKLNFMDSD